MTKKEPDKWLKIEISAHADLMDALGNFLTETGAEGVFQESAAPAHTIGDFPEPLIEEIIKAYFPQDVRCEKKVATIKKYLDSLQEIFPDLQKPSLKTEIVTDPDWGEQWKKYFKPIRVCNNIIVKPTWERYAPASRDIVIEIDPGMAFGTGQHASTRMCMEAIEDIMRKDRLINEWKVLDVGCGTGILGITDAKLGAKDVICVDIDEKAVEITRENAAINNVASALRISSEDLGMIKEPRNLIIANLTSNLLLGLRANLTHLLMPSGYMIISGIIEQDAKNIEEHFSADPLTTYKVITEKEWVCFVLMKKTANI